MRLCNQDRQFKWFEVLQYLPVFGINMRIIEFDVEYWMSLLLPIMELSLPDIKVLIVQFSIRVFQDQLLQLRLLIMSEQFLYGLILDSCICRFYSHIIGISYKLVDLPQLQVLRDTPSFLQLWAG